MHIDIRILPSPPPNPNNDFFRLIPLANFAVLVIDNGYVNEHFLSCLVYVGHDKELTHVCAHPTQQLVVTSSQVCVCVCVCACMCVHACMCLRVDLEQYYRFVFESVWRFKQTIDINVCRTLHVYVGFWLHHLEIFSLPPHSPL